MIYAFLILLQKKKQQNVSGSEEPKKIPLLGILSCFSFSRVERLGFETRSDTSAFEYKNSGDSDDNFVEQFLSRWGNFSGFDNCADFPRSTGSFGGFDVEEFVEFFEFEEIFFFKIL